VNNALFYTTCCEMLAREGVQRVFLTVQSLDAPPTVDEFKFRMGFCPKPVVQRVAIHPWLAPLVRDAGHGWVRRLLERDPGSRMLAKAEGMLRFHLQGRRPLAAQDWPECLAEFKPGLLISQGSESAVAPAEALSPPGTTGAWCWRSPARPGCGSITCTSLSTGPLLNPGASRVPEGMFDRASSAPIGDKCSVAASQTGSGVRPNPLT
jgi:hypothetical protein